MFSIIPRDTEYFEIFDEAAKTVVIAAETYARIWDPGVDRDARIESIRQLEHEMDNICRRVFRKLDRTFLTPFDREDIHRLMKRMDDVVDDIDATTKRLKLYRIEEPTPWLIKQCAILLDASRLIAEAVPHLRNLKSPESLRSPLHRVHRLETEGDENHHSAVADLYETAKDAILAMKWKEIYDLTERAIDRCEDIADVLEGIILKNT